MYSFYWLGKFINDPNCDFKTCLHDVLMLGGDTDTNAAIVCGLIGAYKGIDGIPTDYIESVLSFNFE